MFNISINDHSTFRYMYYQNKFNNITKKVDIVNSAMQISQLQNDFIVIITKIKIQ